MLLLTVLPPASKGFSGGRYKLKAGVRGGSRAAYSIRGKEEFSLFKIDHSFSSFSLFTPVFLWENTVGSRCKTLGDGYCCVVILKCCSNAARSILASGCGVAALRIGWLGHYLTNAKESIENRPW